MIRRLEVKEIAAAELSSLTRLFYCPACLEHTVGIYTTASSHYPWLDGDRKVSKNTIRCMNCLGKFGRASQEWSPIKEQDGETDDHPE